MRAELVTIPFPKLVVKHSFGLVPKRGLVLGAVPPSLVPAYRTGQKSLHKFTRFCKLFCVPLLVALFFIGVAAFAHKRHGSFLEHPEIKKRRPK